MDNKTKFYKTEWFMWLMLIFVAPVGIYMLWKRGKYNKPIRIILSVFFGVFFLSMIINNSINNQNSAADISSKPIVNEQPKEDDSNKPSEFEGITIGQERKLKEFIQAEAKKSINKDGSFDNWKIFKEGDLYTLIFSYITKERNVEVDNKFVATVNWDGKSEKLSLRKINSNPVIVLSTSHIAMLETLAKDAVKANLKAPSTAKFPGTILEADKWNFGATFKGAKEGCVLYQVQSYVDAQNSFGAMLRNNFTVVIEMNWGTNQYVIKSVNFN